MFDVCKWLGKKAAEEAFHRSYIVPKLRKQAPRSKTVKLDKDLPSPELDVKGNGATQPAQHYGIARKSQLEPDD